MRDELAKTFPRSVARATQQPVVTQETLALIQDPLYATAGGN